jgi:ferredoxin/flavodoxin
MDRSKLMRIHAVRLVYFSPTRTAKAIIESIADGIGVDVVEHIDVTRPVADRPDFREMKEDELLVIGAPVYVGRIPEAAVQRFQRMKSNGNPAVIVVLYGNREIGDALLELSDLASAAGCVPVAGGAFIGEHSFSSASIPIAQGRPDAADIGCAREFGKSIGDYLQSIRNLRAIPSLKLPGSRPFLERVKLPKTSPVTENDRCTACEACVLACPTGSISIDEMASTDAETCILCCACVKVCSENARALKDPYFGQIIDWLSSQTVKRKEPQLFMCSI